jgi:hypothetical protein
MISQSNRWSISSIVGLVGTTAIEVLHDGALFGIVGITLIVVVGHIVTPRR